MKMLIKMKRMKKKDNKKILFIIIGLVISIVVANSIIYLAEPIESKIVYTNWILLINSSTAAGLAVLLVVTKFSGGSSHVKLYSSFLYWHVARVAKLLTEIANLSDKNNHLEKTLCLKISSNELRLDRTFSL